MEKKKLLIILGSTLVLILGIGGWYTAKKSDQSAIVETPVDMRSPELGEGLVSSAGSEMVVAEEVRSVDVDGVMQEIQTSLMEDEKIIEEEAANEVEGFEEGAVLMENLGTSYDENEY